MQAWSSRGFLAKEIEGLLEQEEIYWAQRSRLNWLQHGDKNTSYFQHFENDRRKRKMIKNKRMRMDLG
jgi:hypothetical protein